MSKMLITRAQFQLMVECVKQCAREDEVYIEEHGKNSAGPLLIAIEEEEAHLVKLFSLYEHTPITEIEVAD